MTMPLVFLMVLLVLLLVVLSADWVLLYFLDAFSF